MKFDLPAGAKSFTLTYAKYGRDKNTTLQVFYSTDGGATWTSAGETISVSKTSQQSTTLPLNITVPVRFEIRKTDGSANRTNIDNIQVEANAATAPAPVTSTITENYETGSKGSYAAASVALTTGNWFLNEALIGTLESDRKNGTKSVRIRDLGSLEMQFDVPNAQEVTIYHAAYGTDNASTWQLEASTDGGQHWTVQGNVINTSATTLQKATFTVNYSSAVRFRVVKLSGTGTRINIDDVTVSSTATEEDPGTGEDPAPTNPGETSNSVHLTLGNPSGAITDVNQPNNYLLLKTQYVMSYSRDKGTANWVSWHLDNTWIGSTPRQDDFRADATLPSGWYRVGSTDYSGSGFDRGHMCPSADRTASVTDNSATFLMTNMIPQAPRNNQGAWAQLENYCRSLLSSGNEVYIISGGYGMGGSGSNGYTTTIAGGKVTVPSNTWKVIVVLPKGDNDAARITTSTRVIAVDMPNDQNVQSDWKLYRTTVDAIEAKTGYDFLSLVNDNTESVLEATKDAL
ncbi:DNA/RNA non-specific endonuclease [Pontibacter sp. Tf4]|nr:DNA/RNA non-specific endonuclease [Pontibacter sp. Tf4]